MPRASPSNPPSVPLRDGMPAKLRLPRLQRVIVRERLFARLDLQRAGGAVWIAGALGAGKTMLAASYLRAREQSALWCLLPWIGLVLLVGAVTAYAAVAGDDDAAIVDSERSSAEGGDTTARHER
jgi:hypothetical protein